MTSYPPRTTPPMSGGTVMGWFLFLTSLFWPRIVILAFWVFGSEIGDAFSSWVIPTIGFFVAPWTTMSYALLWGISSSAVSGVEWVFVGLAVLFDLATWVGARQLFRR